MSLSQMQFLYAFYYKIIIGAVNWRSVPIIGASRLLSLPMAHTRMSHSVTFGTSARVFIVYFVLHKKKIGAVY